jgi:short-subunit dehydrogenase
MKRLAGKVVLITGASMGIGKALAHAFAAEGARIAVAARSLDKLEALSDSLPTESIALRTDISQPAAASRMIQTTVEHFKHLDILINNAGVGMIGAMENLIPPDVEKLLATNFLGPLCAIQAAIPVMRSQGGGQIINIGSVASLLPIPGIGIYSGTKFALRALSDALRLELKNDGIHVLLVCPGRVENDFSKNAFRSANHRSFSSIRGINNERVARRVVSAAIRRKRMIVVPAYLRVLVCLRALAPALFDSLMQRTMGSRTGRT